MQAAGRPQSPEADALHDYELQICSPVTAIYGDGVGEPEVYVDRSDWDNFGPLEFSLKISFMLDGFAVRFEFESMKEARISVKKFNADEFPPLTENIDLKADFDLIIAANGIIDKVRNALYLADKLIQKLSQSFNFTSLENFPHGKLLVNQTSVQGK
ncbi:hypothetical protein ACTXT7_005642 [Hymenolepis weldensis]